jgi:hypothetical protein|uniref:Uncharacterized protein n=1 Tax=viral metagenome TaxID=1070528 RepID=A0A6C0ILN9_9ZZZZ
MSSINKAVMLEALGWSRGGEITNHLPDEIVDIIRQFTFFDIRTDLYNEHLIKKDIKEYKLYVLEYMMNRINYGLKRHGTGKYGVEYSSINIESNCCTICGDFVPVWDREPIPENIRCFCRFISEEEIMDLENQRQDNDCWEEEQETEKEQDRRRNREFDKDFEDDISSLDDNSYSDRKPNWDEGSECNLDYDYCDDDNSYY